MSFPTAHSSHGRIVAWAGVLGLVLSAATIPRAWGGCGQTGLCCEGKNNTCRAEGARVSNNDSFTCFCDAGCMDLADCCADYRAVCNPIDCVLSKEWTEWSDCDVSCGFGSRRRTRQVLVHPGNNGRPCQPTVQMLVCEATQCRASSTTYNPHNGLDELRECAEIVPVAIVGSRPIETEEMILEQGFANEMDEAVDEKKHERHPYCARYELTETHHSCQSATTAGQWSVSVSSKAMTRGLTVCVECPSLSMRTHLGGRCRGHGVHQMETRWNAVTIPGCHGRWIMMTRHRSCRCRPEVEPSFVFL